MAAGEEDDRLCRRACFAGSEGPLLITGAGGRLTLFARQQRRRRIVCAGECTVARFVVTNNLRRVDFPDVAYLYS